jgi:hypothetical protein
LQIRRFRQERDAKLIRPKHPYITSGLWRYSRHPNFFGEVSFWWAIYLFSVADIHSPLNWSIGGTLLLTLLFQGSTAVTEHLALQKYPTYAEYQHLTSRLLPWFPGDPVQHFLTGHRLQHITHAHDADGAVIRNSSSNEGVQATSPARRGRGRPKSPSRTKQD